MEKEKILIIEDSSLQGRFTMDILNKNGYNVQWIKTAEEAIGIYKDFDLILLDVILPGMSGYELCKKIKSVDPLTHIMMITSMDEEDSLVNALEKGADDYIKKPFNVQELLARIKVQLRTRKLKEELILKNQELQKAYETIKSIAVTDMLTGVYNRSYIKEYIKDIGKRSKSLPINIVCMMIDIDNFKNVNDNYGHLVGDMVLSNLATICKSIVGDRGIVVRFGGEEFLIILDKENPNLFEFAESIREECEKARVCNLNVTVSIGVNEFVVETDRFLKDFEEGLKEADRMLYVSKNTGKNKVTVSRINN